MKQKALLLLSGGIDSPVAGFVAIKKGFELVAIHFSQEPFTDNSPEIKAITAAKKLGLGELIVVGAGEALKEIADKTYREYYFILMKRFFMKVSEKIAEKEGCDFLITGESLGQVSSQTMSNLNNINQAIKMEIIRPLIFLEKQEIIDISQKEGFFESSCGKEMCDALASGKPKTKSNLEKIIKEEEKCETDLIAKDATQKIRVEKII